VWISTDGSNYTLKASGTLLNQANYSMTLDLEDTVAKRVKLVITSGHSNSWWELAEFVVNGLIIE
jgi:hypothetical protein